MYKIPSEFSKFIQIDCDRKDFIQKYLQRYGIDSAVIKIEEYGHVYNHILVNFPLTHYDKAYKIKTVIAHYDRVLNTPGANDNSAAVYSMLEWAVRLKNYADKGNCHNIRLILSDGEELGEMGVTTQGAYCLASLFRKLRIINDDIYVFDCMGRGTIPILTETVLPSRISKDFLDSYRNLERRAQQLLRSACGKEWYSIPCNYSDNAGFIANGIPAVAITLLPKNEIIDAIKGIKPKTWKLNHCMEDNIDSIDGEAFEVTARILNKLAHFQNLQ